MHNIICNTITIFISIASNAFKDSFAANGHLISNIAFSPTNPSEEQVNYIQIISLKL